MDLYLDSCGNDGGEVAGIRRSCQQYRRCNDEARHRPTHDLLSTYTPRCSRRECARWPNLSLKVFMGGLHSLPFLISFLQS